MLPLRLPAAALALVLASGLACQRGPVVPALGAFGTVDPAVSTLLAQQLASLAERPADADRWGVLGMTLEANGLTPNALEAYATATTLPASHGRWWYHAGRLRARQGDSAGALTMYDEAIKLSPTFVPVRVRRGLLLLDSGDLGAAEAAFRTVGNLAPDDSGGVTGLARVQLAQGRPSEAVRTLEALIERSPRDRYAYQVLATAYRALGRVEEAAEAAAAGATGEPIGADAWADEVGAYRRGFASALKDATALADQGRHQEAIGLLEGLRRERPDDRELTTYLGGVYAAAGRTADARPLLEQELAVRPENFDATMNLATAHLFDRAYGEADRVVSRALDLRPNDTDATRLRGVVAWRRGDVENAERWLSAAAAANPKDARVWAWIGSIRLARKQSTSALAAYREALTRDPLLGEALVGGASAALAARAVDDARRWVARARKVAPTERGLADIELRLASAAKGRS